MLNYRLYFTEAPSGHISRVEEIAESVDDLQAINRAHAFVGRQALELWDCNRLVCRFAAIPWGGGVPISA